MLGWPFAHLQPQSPKSKQRIYYPYGNNIGGEMSPRNLITHFPPFPSAGECFIVIFTPLPELPGGQLVVFTFARASRAASASAAIAL